MRQVANKKMKNEAIAERIEYLTKAMIDRIDMNTSLELALGRTSKALSRARTGEKMLVDRVRSLEEQGMRMAVLVKRVADTQRTAINTSKELVLAMQRNDALEQDLDQLRNSMARCNTEQDLQTNSNTGQKSELDSIRRESAAAIARVSEAHVEMVKKLELSGEDTRMALETQREEAVSRTVSLATELEKTHTERKLFEEENKSLKVNKVSLEKSICDLQEKEAEQNSSAQIYERRIAELERKLESACRDFTTEKADARTEAKMSAKEVPVNAGLKNDKEPAKQATLSIAPYLATLKVSCCEKDRTESRNLGVPLEKASSVIKDDFLVLEGSAGAKENWESESKRVLGNCGLCKLLRHEIAGLKQNMSDQQESLAAMLAHPQEWQTDNVVDSELIHKMEGSKRARSLIVFESAAREHENVALQGQLHEIRKECSMLRTQHSHDKSVIDDFKQSAGLHAAELAEKADAHEQMLNRLSKARQLEQHCAALEEELSQQSQKADHLKSRTRRQTVEGHRTQDDSLESKQDGTGPRNQQRKPDIVAMPWPAPPPRLFASEDTIVPASLSSSSEGPSASKRAFASKLFVLRRRLEQVEDENCHLTQRLQNYRRCASLIQKKCDNASQQQASVSDPRVQEQLQALRTYCESLERKQQFLADRIVARDMAPRALFCMMAQAQDSFQRPVEGPYSSALDVDTYMPSFSYPLPPIASTSISTPPEHSAILSQCKSIEKDTSRLEKLLETKKQVTVSQQVGRIEVLSAASSTAELGSQRAVCVACGWEVVPSVILETDGAATNARCGIPERLVNRDALERSDWSVQALTPRVFTREARESKPTTHERGSLETAWVTPGVDVVPLAVDGDYKDSSPRDVVETCVRRCERTDHTHALQPLSRHRSSAGKIFYSSDEDSDATAVGNAHFAVDGDDTSLSPRKSTEGGFEKSDHELALHTMARRHSSADQSFHSSDKNADAIDVDSAPLAVDGDDTSLLPREETEGGFENGAEELALQATARRRSSADDSFQSLDESVDATESLGVTMNEGTAFGAFTTRYLSSMLSKSTSSTSARGDFVHEATTSNTPFSLEQMSLYERRISRLLEDNELLAVRIRNYQTQLGILQRTKVVLQQERSAYRAQAETSTQDLGRVRTDIGFIDRTLMWMREAHLQHVENAESMESVLLLQCISSEMEKLKEEAKGRRGTRADSALLQVQPNTEKQETCTSGAVYDTNERSCDDGASPVTATSPSGSWSPFGLGRQRARKQTSTLGHDKSASLDPAWNDSRDWPNGDDYTEITL